MTSGYLPSDLGKLCRLAVLRLLHDLDNTDESKEASDDNDVDNLIEGVTRLKINDNNENVLGNEVRRVRIFISIFLKTKQKTYLCEL